MSRVSGMRFLVIGSARAGCGMATSLAGAGATVVVVDQKPADTPQMLGSVDLLASRGIEVVTNWVGDVDWQAYDVIAPSPGVPQNHPVLREAIQRGLPIWSEIEVAYRLSKAPIIGITGTNGKSTVTALTHHVLMECGAKSILCGNIAGSGLAEQPITTAAASASEDEILVAEVSSFQLEWIEEFRPARATITRITPDHLDRYHSLEEYAATKQRIFVNQTEADIAVMNSDRPETFASEMRAKKLSYGSADGDVAISPNSIASNGLLVEQKDLWAGGLHTLQNAACAWLLAGSYVPFAEAAKALTSFRGIANRMEALGEANGVRFINNSMCTNPDALVASLDAAQPPLILLAGGVAKVESMGAFSGLGKKGIREAILFGRDARILADAFAAEGIDCLIANTLPDAFEIATKTAVRGDTVILSPGAASFDQFEDFIQRGEVYRDLVHSYVQGVTA